VVRPQILNIVIAAVFGATTLSLALGWAITYDIIPTTLEQQNDYNYWDIVDICKSISIFSFSVLVYFLILQVRLKSFWKHISGIYIVYFLLNLIGDIALINEEGNWITLFTGAVFTYIIVRLLIPFIIKSISICKKWLLYIKYYFKGVAR